jgi:hypothetical protein
MNEERTRKCLRQVEHIGGHLGQLITGFATRVTRRVPLAEQDLFTLPEHLGSPPVCSGARVFRSLVLYVLVMTST